MVTTIDKIEFTSQINIDNGHVNNPLGIMKSSMELYQFDEDSEPEPFTQIEWYVQEIDEIVHMNIEYHIENGKKIVTGYDGVFELPEQAIELLEKNGFNCDEVKD